MDTAMITSSSLADERRYTDLVESDLSDSGIPVKGPFTRWVDKDLQVGQQVMAEMVGGAELVTIVSIDVDELLAVVRTARGSEHIFGFTSIWIP